MKNHFGNCLILGGVVLIAASFWFSGSEKPYVEVSLIDQYALADLTIDEEHQCQLRIDNNGATLARIVGTNAC